MELHAFIGQITRIGVYPRSESFYYSVVDNYKWQTGRRWLFWPTYTIIKKAVVTISLFGGDELVGRVEDFVADTDYFVENDKVFHKPHCDIYFSDGKYHTKVFKTEQELAEFVEHVTSIVPTIKLT